MAEGSAAFAAGPCRGLEPLTSRSAAWAFSHVQLTAEALALRSAAVGTSALPKRRFFQRRGQRLCVSCRVQGPVERQEV